MVHHRKRWFPSSADVIVGGMIPLHAELFGWFGWEDTWDGVEHDVGRWEFYFIENGNDTRLMAIVPDPASESNVTDEELSWVVSTVFEGQVYVHAGKHPGYELWGVPGKYRERR